MNGEVWAAAVVVEDARNGELKMWGGSGPTEEAALGKAMKNVANGFAVVGRLVWCAARRETEEEKG